MNLSIPQHQFEIRFTQLIGFPDEAKKILSRFVPLASNVQIEEEHSVNIRYILNFDKENYAIVLTWDRLLFRFEGDIGSLAEANSIVEEPFFSIFNDLIANPCFGSVTNTLLSTICINHIEGKTLQQLTDEFSERYLNDESRLILDGNCNDVAITLDKFEGSKQTIMTFGPYQGLKDLRDRNILPRNTKIVKRVNDIGEMAEIRVFDTLKTMNFSVYKDLLKETLKLVNKLWE